MNKALPPLSSLDGVKLLTHLSKSQIYRMIRAGTFPAPVKTSVKSVAWKGEHLQAWLDGLTPAPKGAAA